STEVFEALSLVVLPVLQCPRPLPSRLDNPHGNRIKLEGPPRRMAIPFRPFHPSHGIGIGSGPQLPARNATQIVGNHIMVSDAFALVPAVLMDAVQQLDQFYRL